MNFLRKQKLFVYVANEGVAEVFYRKDERILNCARSDGMGEAEFFRLGDALIWAEDGADFSAEADFAEDDVFFGEFPAGGRRGNRHTDGEVGSGVV